MHAKPNCSRMYFVALLKSATILDKMPLTLGIPVIKHSMPETYYKALLFLEGVRLNKFLLALEAKHGEDEGIDDGAIAHALDEAGSLAISSRRKQLAIEDQLEIPAPTTPPAELATINMVGMQLLFGPPADRVNLAAKFMCGSHAIHFDNFTHASRKQRAFVRCPHRAHEACFRYLAIDTTPSQNHAIAFLAAWADHARSAGKHYSKEQHKRYQPSSSEIACFLSDIHEVTDSGDEQP